jgi:hypothetical protein
MTSWSHFATAAPRLAARMRMLLAPPGAPSFGYLATVRPDGGPRVHPVMPLVTDGGLYCFLVPSPKRRDLERDRRYALHALPGERGDQEAYLTGSAVRVTDRRVVDRLAGRFHASPEVDWWLFELHIEVAMVGGPGPTYEIWHAPGPSGHRQGQLCVAAAGRVE